MKKLYILLLLICLIFFFTSVVKVNCADRIERNLKTDLSPNSAFTVGSSSERGTTRHCWYWWPGWWMWTSDPTNCWGIFNDCTGNYGISIMSYITWNPGFMHGWNIGGLMIEGWQYPQVINEDFAYCDANQIVYDANFFWGNDVSIMDHIYDLDIGHYGNNCEMISIDNPDDTFVFKTAEDLTRRAQLEYYTRLSDRFSKKPQNMWVEATALAWDYANADDFTVREIILKNESKKKKENFYIGVYMDVDAKEDDIAGIHSSPYNVAEYDEELRTAYIYHPDHENYGVAGVTFISDTPTSVIISIGYHETSEFCDNWLYSKISSGEIQTEELGLEDRRILMAFGPIDTLTPGATFYFAYAFVMGKSINEFKTNTQTVIEAYKGYVGPPKMYDWIIPNPPPDAPKMFLTPGNRRVDIKWSRNRNIICVTRERGGEKYLDCNEYPDSDYNYGSESGADPSSLERDWAGYRIYRNMSGMGTPEDGDYHMLIEMNMTYVYDCLECAVTGQSDNVIPEKELDPRLWDTTYWCNYTDTDPSLYNGYSYYYSVIAYDTGAPEEDPPLPSAESSVTANLASATPFWDKEHTPEQWKKKVEVVPNPYKAGQYEGWGEKIQFIHVPDHCTLKIYSFGGDLIWEHKHNKPGKNEITWYLKNNDNKDIAAGVYFYHIESPDGNYEGKFVIFR